jgi:hypothetical protein
MHLPVRKSQAKQPVPNQPFPGMGRMTIAEISRQYGLDQASIVAHLASKGIDADPDKSVKEIAAAHHTDPHALFDLIHAAALR